LILLLLPFVPFLMKFTPHSKYFMYARRWIVISA